MELETKDLTDTDYNTFFYATMCHVCKRFDKGAPLGICCGCDSISYCSKQHQDQHWPQHKPLCEAVNNLRKLEQIPDSKVTLMKAVEEKKGSLEFYEGQMFYFPRECAVCYERNAESLNDCDKCAISFCINHINSSTHTNACYTLGECLKLNLSIIRGECNIGRLLNRFLEYMKTFNKFQDIYDVVNSYGNTQGHTELPYILAAHLSVHITRPLTLFYAMKVLDYVSKRKDLVIHVVTATYFEKFHIWKMWEILLHFMSEIETLMIIVIGTGLSKESHFSTCNDCLSRNKSISLEFYGGLHQDYLRSQSFVKPDLAVGFDVDIQTEDDNIFTAEIKEQSVQILAEQNCPFILTSHTKETLKNSMDRINTILNREVNYVHYGENPFHSIRSTRLIGEKLTFYENNYVVIYRSLSFIIDMYNLSNRN